MTPARIRHTVVFTPHHAAGSPEEDDLLDAARRLAAIPGVEGLDLAAEISPKNAFRWGLTMEFADATAYAAYNEHPDHLRFVSERWIPEVRDFLEIDLAAR